MKSKFVVGGLDKCCPTSTVALVQRFAGWLSEANCQIGGASQLADQPLYS